MEVGKSPQAEQSFDLDKLFESGKTAQPISRSASEEQPESPLVAYARLSKQKSKRFQAQTLQVSKDGQSLTCVTKNGKIAKFFAATIAKIFRVDVYDKFQIAHEKRQRLAAEKFFNELVKYGYEPRDHATKLNVGDLHAHLRDSGALYMRGVNTPVDPGMRKVKPVNVGDQLAFLARIDNYEELPVEQRKALKAVHNYWKNSLDKSHTSGEADKLLRQTVANSKPFLHAVSRSPEIAGQYLEKCSKLEKQLGDHILGSMDQKLEQAEIFTGAMELMSGFSELSDWVASFGLPIVVDQNSPHNCECAFAPAWAAANNIKSNQEMRENLAAGGGANMRTLLQAADRIPQEAAISGSAVLGRISETGLHDPILVFCVSLKPIRVCLDVSGVSRSADFANNAANSKDVPEKVLMEWADAANGAISRHGLRQAKATADSRGRFFSFESISGDIYAKESFDYCTGLKWDRLDDDQKHRASNVCMQLARAEKLTGLSVESRLVNMRELIEKCTMDQQFSEQFNNSISGIQDNFVKFSEKCVSQDTGYAEIAANFTNNVSKPVLELVRQMPFNVEFEALANLVAGNALHVQDAVTLKKFEEAVSRQGSGINTLLMTLQSKQAAENRQLMPDPGLEKVGTGRDQRMFAMNSLQNFANHLSRTSKVLGNRDNNDVRRDDLGKQSPELEGTGESGSTTKELGGEVTKQLGEPEITAIDVPRDDSDYAQQLENMNKAILHALS